jgi:hypothetical protein
MPIYHSWERSRGFEVNLHPFLNMTLDGGEWSASCFFQFTPGQRALGTLWMGGRSGRGKNNVL